MICPAFWFSGKRDTFCGVLRSPLFLCPWRVKVFCFVRASMRDEGNVTVRFM